MSSDNLSTEPVGSEFALEKPIDAICVDTVFADREALRAIALEMMNEGLTTGYQLYSGEGGCMFRGEMLIEGQFLLRVIIPAGESAKLALIRSQMDSRVGDDWAAPCTVDYPVKATRKTLEFILDETKEHDRFIKAQEAKKRAETAQKTLKIVYCISGVIILSLAAVLGKFTYDERVEHARLEERAAERERVLDRLSELAMQVDRDMGTVDYMLTFDEPLTALPNDMSLFNGHEETQAVRDDVWKAVKEFRDLVEFEKSQHGDR